MNLDQNLTEKRKVLSYIEAVCCVQSFTLYLQ